MDGAAARLMEHSAWNADCFCRLLEARLWVARLGEGDVLGWWRTDGILGPDGAFVGSRVLPRTHSVGRARIAFAAAKQACQERYRSPDAIHLFRLDPWVEDSFDAYLQDSLADQENWAERLGALESITAEVKPLELLNGRQIVSDETERMLTGRPLGPDGRSLELPGADSVSQLVELMAAGFTRGSAGQLVVPYIAGGQEPNGE